MQTALHLYDCHARMRCSACLRGRSPVCSANISLRLGARDNAATPLAFRFTLFQRRRRQTCQQTPHGCAHWRIIAAALLEPYVA